MKLLFPVLRGASPNSVHRVPLSSVLQNSFSPSARYFSNFRVFQTLSSFPQGNIYTSWPAPKSSFILPSSARLFSIATQKNTPQNTESKTGDEQFMTQDKQPQNLSSTPSEQIPKRSGPLGFFLDAKDKFKEMIKSFGYFVVAAYFTLYLIVLSFIYMLVKVNLIPTPDVNGWINSMRLKKIIMGDDEVDIPEWCADFATAWVVTKTTEPVRLIATIAAVPILLRKLPFNFLRLFRISPEALSKIRK